MSEDNRSEQVCPVCGKHTLAVDEPPRIDIMGVQVYSDLVGMGDVAAGGALGIVCLSCDTRWADKDAFDRGEPEPPVDDDPDAAALFDNEADGDKAQDDGGAA